MGSEDLSSSLGWDSCGCEQFQYLHLWNVDTNTDLPTSQDFYGGQIIWKYLTSKPCINVSYFLTFSLLGNPVGPSPKRCLLLLLLTVMVRCNFTWLVIQGVGKKSGLRNKMGPGWSLKSDWKGRQGYKVYSVELQRKWECSLIYRRGLVVPFRYFRMRNSLHFAVDLSTACIRVHACSLTVPFLGSRVFFWLYLELIQN